MSSKNVAMLIIITLSLSFFNSCTEENPNVNNPEIPNENFAYPYSLNSFWYYSTFNYVTNFRPDSLRNIFLEDTISGNGIARFVTDTSINSDTFRILRNTHSSEGHEHTSIELFKQSDTGLIRYGYYSSGTNFGPFRLSPFFLSIGENARKFSSGFELLKWHENPSMLGDTTFVFDDPPVNVLKYPITDGLEWKYQDYGPTKINKCYDGFQNVTTQAGSFYCARVKRKWYFNNSSSADTNFFQIDYFSESGMVKRDFIIKNVLVTNNTGVPLGYIDVVENAELNIVTIP
mgnify:CR=1 FL=1